MKKIDNEVVKLVSKEVISRYFSKFGFLLKHLQSISESESEAGMEVYDAPIILDELRCLQASFEALKWKYMYSGHEENTDHISIDTTDSGFPMSTEIAKLQNDIKKAEQELNRLPSASELKSSMIDVMMNKKKVPFAEQKQMAKRHYYTSLLDGRFFLSQNEPQIIPVGMDKGNETYFQDHRRYLVHWSVYDTSTNYPTVYVMIVDESSKESLLKDNQEFIKDFKNFLLAQSRSKLLLISIGQHIDEKFKNHHPKSIKRIHIGPLFSNSFTQHTNNVERLLEHATVGRDWIFHWNVETLTSKSVKHVKKGMFGGEVLKEIFDLDSKDHTTFKKGVTELDEFVIMPYEAYQCLSEDESNPLHAAYKYVVGPDGEIISNI